MNDSNFITIRLCTPEEQMPIKLTYRITLKRNSMVCLISAVYRL